MDDVIQVYRGKDGQFYWRRKSPNGQVVSVGGEGYKTLGGAHAAAERENPNLEITDENGNDPLG